MKRAGLLSQIRKAPVDKVLDLIGHQASRSKRCVAVFLERCQAEIAQDVALALRLCTHGPDYVDRAVPGESRSDYLAWSYGVLGTCLSAGGTPRLADDTFQIGMSLDRVDPGELAALKTRYAVHKARFDWAESYKMINEAVEASRSDRGPFRDDRSHPMSLASRGTIRAYGIDLGRIADSSLAIADYRNTLDILSQMNKPFLHTRLTAVLGFTTLISQMWLRGEDSAEVSPLSVLRDISRIERELRHHRIPKRSVVDCMCRWATGLALFKLAANILTREARRKFTTARSDFVKMGRLLPAVEITLDMQWCLIHSGEFAEALREQKFIRDRVGALPEEWQWQMDLWDRGLTRRVLKVSLIEQVFQTVRGCQKISLPLPVTANTKSSMPVGW